MKTQKITLRGQAFTLTDAAERELRSYLKELGRATVIQKSAYLECTEALRDVLEHKAPKGKTVSAKMVKEAIAVVGVPPVTTENIFTSAKLALHDLRVRLLRLEGGWRDVRRLGLAILAFLSLLAGVFAGAASFLLVILDHQSMKGSYQEFSFGVVRMMGFPTLPKLTTTFIVAGLLFVVGACLTVCGYWLVREKHGWKPWIGVAVGVLLFGAAFMRISSPTDTLSFLESNRVYLQTCGTEVPMYLPDASPLATYDQLYKEGYRLAAKVPTNRGNMLMDATVLCTAYDKLAAGAGRDPVLLLYKQAPDGSTQPFDQYNDVGGNWTFGLFAKL